MEGWIFTFGVDGFGADVAPAYEEGVYLNFDKAFKRLCELNSKMLNSNHSSFFEKGYGEDHYPDDDIVTIHLFLKKDMVKIIIPMMILN